MRVLFSRLLYFVWQLKSWIDVVQT